MTQNLPTYVERGGGQVFRPPYAARTASLLCLVLRADTAAIDALLHRDLCAPSGGAVDYRCAHANVVVVLASIERMTSKDPVDALKGYLPEQELSIWCLAADTSSKQHRLVWYLPYVLTDSGRPVAAGREVYGYPKQLGDFDPSYESVFGDQGATTSISAVAIDTYGPKATAEILPFVTVARKPGPGKQPVAAGSSLVEELTGNLFPGGLSVSVGGTFTTGTAPSATITAGATAAPPQQPGPSAWIKPIIAALTGKGLSGDPSELMAELVANPSLVFLKQFRDATCPTKACYQAIIEAPLSPDPIGASMTPLDPGLFQISIESWDSDPLAADLGIAASTPLVPERAFLAGLNFDVMTGLEVWRAPT